MLFFFLSPGRNSSLLPRWSGWTWRMPKKQRVSASKSQTPQRAFVIGRAPDFTPYVRTRLPSTVPFKRRVTWLSGYCNTRGGLAPPTAPCASQRFHCRELSGSGVPDYRIVRFPLWPMKRYRKRSSVDTSFQATQLFNVIIDRAAVYWIVDNGRSKLKGDLGTHIFIPKVEF
jgi:hypothetical protein